MDDATKHQTANPTNDDLRRGIWLPLTLSGVGSALGVLGLLLAFGAVRSTRGFLPIFASIVNVFHTWLAPDFRSELLLASGSRGEKVLEIILQLAKRALFGVAVIPIGYLCYGLYVFFFVLD